VRGAGGRGRTQAQAGEGARQLLPAVVDHGRPGLDDHLEVPADVAIDVHDVKLRSGPPGARRFHSEPAASGYRFERKLKQAGRYKIVCTLHEEMNMTIRVRR